MGFYKLTKPDFSLVPEGTTSSCLFKPWFVIVERLSFFSSNIELL